MGLEPLVDEELVAAFARRAVPSLSSAIRSPENLKLLGQIKGQINGREVYPTVKLSILYAVTLEATSLLNLESILPGEACSEYTAFLSLIRDLLDGSSDPEIHILEDALFHYQSLLHNRDLLRGYFLERRNLARQHFKTDRDKEDFSFPENPCQGAIDFCYLRHPELDHVHLFFGGSLLEKLFASMEFLEPEERRKVLDRFKKEIPRWIEGVRRKDEGLCGKYYHIIHEASVKAYPAEHERFYSFGRNLAVLASKGTSLSDFLDMMVFEDRLLSSRKVFPTQIGFITKSQTPDALQKTGFHINYEAARFVPKEDVSLYLESSKKIVNEIAKQRDASLIPV